MQATVSLIKHVFPSFEHSKGRVPYTYHHDFLRAKCKAFEGKSRAYVADNHDSSELELYAIALVYVAENAPLKELLKTLQFFIGLEDLLYSCIEISESVVKRINKNHVV